MRKFALIQRTISIILMASAVFLMGARRDGPIKIEPPQGTWKTNFTSGVLAARKPGMCTMVMFSATWCPDCKRMKANVFTNEAVQKKLLQWDTMYVDIDMYPKLADEYKTPAIPTVILLDTKGRELTRVQDDMTTGQFIAWTDDMLARNAAFEKLDKQLAKKPKNAKLLMKKADMLADLGLTMVKVEPRVMIPMPMRLQEALDCYKQASAAGAKVPASQIEYIGIVMQALNGDMDAATRRFAEFERQYPKDPHAADAMFWRAVLVRIAQVNAIKNAPDKKTAPLRTDYKPVQAMFQAYLDKYPNGRYADPARRIFGQIKGDQEAAKKAAEKEAKKQAEAEAKAKTAQDQSANQKAEKK
ncbi:thioredoxin family protein [bacterium]|nr:thioredoxin family protein [bacterium]